jgi:hypothetical protein
MINRKKLNTPFLKGIKNSDVLLAEMDSRYRHSGMTKRLDPETSSG